MGIGEGWKERAFLGLSLLHRPLAEGGEDPRNPGLPALSWDPTPGTHPTPTLTWEGKATARCVYQVTLLGTKQRMLSRESDTHLWRTGGQEAKTSYLGPESECWQCHISPKALGERFPLSFPETELHSPHFLASSSAFKARSIASGTEVTRLSCTKSLRFQWMENPSGITE